MARKFHSMVIVASFFAQYAFAQKNIDYKWNDSSGDMKFHPSQEDLKQLEKVSRKDKAIQKIDAISAPVKPSSVDKSVISRLMGGVKLEAPSKNDAISQLKLTEAPFIGSGIAPKTSAAWNIGIDKNRIQKRNLLRAMSFPIDVRRHLYRYSQCGARAYESIVLVENGKSFAYDQETTFLAFTYDCQSRCSVRKERIVNGKPLGLQDRAAKKANESIRPTGLSEPTLLDESICDALWNSAGLDVDGL